MVRYAFSLIIFTFVVITLGALTRLLDAGLGCPDWPVCYGRWVPSDDVSHTVFSLWAYDEGKAWMEMIHRYAASILGLLVLIQAAIIWFKSSIKATGFLKKLSFILFIWVIIQGLFGMWTVTLRLWPPVVSAHLLGGAITLGLQFIIWRHLKKSVAVPVFVRTNGPWIVFSLLVFFQMALGAWTSSQYAGLACPDFPTCQGRWWIEIDSGVLHAPMVAGDEYLGGVQTMKQRMAVQWLHRLGALAVLLAFIGLCLRSDRQVKTLWFVGAILSAQIMLGVLNAVLLLPLSLALLHNTFAMLLWLSSLSAMIEAKIKITSNEGYHGKDEPVTHLVT